MTNVEEWTFVGSSGVGSEVLELTVERRGRKEFGSVAWRDQKPLGVRLQLIREPGVLGMDNSVTMKLAREGRIRLNGLRTKQVLTIRMGKDVDYRKVSTITITLISNPIILLLVLFII